MNKFKFGRHALIIGGVVAIFLIAYLIASFLIGQKPQPALDIIGPDASGKLHSLSDNYGQSPTALLFFDTKTEKATELLEQLIELTDDYDVDLMAVAVNGDYEEQKKELKEKGIDFPHLLFDVEGEMAKTYNVTTTPVAYFIDKNGMMQQAFISSITDKTLKKTLAALD